MSAFRLRALLGMLLTSAVAAADATEAPQPSFSCARASTPAEHAICANPELAKQDVAIARSYRAALSRLDPAATSALKADQRGFVQLRDMLLDDNRSSRDAGLPAGNAIEDLASLLRERAAFLDAIVAPSTVAFAGTWKNVSGEATIRRKTDGTLAVNINAAEPSAGRWVCDFSGHGRIGSNGQSVVTPDDSEGASLSLQRVGATLRIQALPARGEESPVLSYCGLNGSVDGGYFQIRSSAN